MGSNNLKAGEAEMLSKLIDACANLHGWCLQVFITGTFDSSNGESDALRREIERSMCRVLIIQSMMTNRHDLDLERMNLIYDDEMRKVLEGLKAQSSDFMGRMYQSLNLKNAKR